MIIAVYGAIVCLPYSGSLSVSDETKNSFSIDNFYSQDVGGERVKALDDPADAFLYRIDIIRGAKKSILFSTFLFYQGNMPDIFVGALLDAADRGVDVIIIVDKWSGIPACYKNCFINNPNIHFYVFNPLNLLKPEYINVSLHDKYLIADDSYFITGGRNIANKYFDADSPHFQSDQDVLIYDPDPASAGGGAVSQAKEYYYGLIDSPLAKNYTALSAKNKAKAGADALRYEDSFNKYCVANNMGGGEIDYYGLTMAVNKITLVSNKSLDKPKKEPVIAYTLLNLAKSSQNITFQVAYVVLTKQDYNLFSDAIQGKNVTLITNSLAASKDPFAFSNFYINRKKYLKTELNIYEYQSYKACLHDKCYLFGDELTAIGSFNLDERSIRVDTETMVVIDSPEFNALTKSVLQETLDQSLKVNPATNAYEPNDNVSPAKIAAGKKPAYIFLGYVMSIVKYLL